MTASMSQVNLKHGWVGEREGGRGERGGGRGGVSTALDPVRVRVHVTLLVTSN